MSKLSGILALARFLIFFFVLAFTVHIPLRYLPVQAKTVIAWLCAGTAVYFAYRWYTVRMLFRRLQTLRLPVMPHSMIWGHLGLLKILPPLDCPLDAYNNYMHQRFVRNWQMFFPGEKTCPHVWYIDFWPLVFPFMIVSDPVVSAQYMTNPSAPKDVYARQFLYPLTKNLDLVTSEGQSWKMWRARFNPGFSTRNLLGLLPKIKEEVQTYVDIMKEKAGKSKDEEGGGWGEMFKMEEYTTKMTFDVIGRAALGMRLGSQKGNGTGLRETLAETVGLLVLEKNIYTIWKLISPLTQYRMWRNNRRMDRMLMPIIERELRRAKEEGFGAQTTVLELGVKSAKAELEVAAGTDIGKLDPMFVETLLAQLKIFLFAGHDTTATSLCWIFHELQKNPEVLRKMREEHNRVFGTDVEKTTEMLVANPALVNAVPYTQGVIKEGLRLHPNLGSGRQGSKDLNLTNVPGYEGLVFPTEGMMIWDGVLAMHTREDLWTRADEFLPERWMTTDENDELHPPKNAWRPFSIGPRNCIGQELAMLEMKLTMILMARVLDVEEAWEDWDRKMNGKGGKETYYGERLYQVLGATPHPKHGMPAHVRLARR